MSPTSIEQSVTFLLAGASVGLILTLIFSFLRQRKLRRQELKRVEDAEHLLKAARERAGVAQERVDDAEASLNLSKLLAWHRDNLVRFGEQDSVELLRLAAEQPEQLEHLVRSIEKIIDEYDLTSQDPIVLRFNYVPESTKDPQFGNQGIPRESGGVRLQLDLPTAHG